jgi:hypothetical protein
MDANATQLQNDLAILERLKGSAKLTNFNIAIEKNPNLSREEMLGFDPKLESKRELEKQQAESLQKYNEEGGDVGAIANYMESRVPAYGALAVSEPIAMAATPNPPVKPVATPGQLLRMPSTAVTAGKNILRAQPAAMAIQMPLENLMTGAYEKKSANDDGYDFSKHGMYLEFPGIDVGRIPYYFNRTMYDAGKGLVDGVKSLF